jgi:hypothetical protein
MSCCQILFRKVYYYTMSKAAPLSGSPEDTPAPFPYQADLYRGAEKEPFVSMFFEIPEHKAPAFSRPGRNRREAPKQYLSAIIPCHRPRDTRGQARNPCTHTLYSDEHSPLARQKLTSLITKRDTGVFAARPFWVAACFS